jgi:hypothetical protein
MRSATVHSGPGRANAGARWRVGVAATARRAVVLAVAMLLAGCASLVDRASNRLGTQLSAGILDHDDPATVAAGLPAYLLLLDGLNQDPKASPARLCLAGRLYGAYAGSFVAEPDRAKRLSARALDYAARGACASGARWCGLPDGSYEAVDAAVATASRKDLEALACLGTAWAGYIQNHADDWDAIADIPKARRVIERVVELEPTHAGGEPQLYLGVMNSLLPPAYGGKPDVAQGHFERAIELSAGRNQMARVLYARHYARMVFDQELHDRLLDEALAADPEAPGLTLMNTLAREQARQLKDSSKDYFE